MISSNEYEAVRELIDSIQPIPPLPKSEEVVLIRKAQSGDQDAMMTLIRAYTSLALDIAAHQGPSEVPLPDRFQDAIEGIIEAVRRYDDPEGQTPLLAYSKWRMRWATQRGARAWREEPLAAEDAREVGASLPAPEPEPDDIDDPEVSRLLDTFLEPVERDAIRLRYRRTPVPDEVAAWVLGLDVEGYRQVLQEAKRKVAERWVPTERVGEFLEEPEPESPQVNILGGEVLWPVREIRTENRQRRDLGDLSELAESIRQNGLLQPILVTEDGTLLVGERRLRAVQLLGWEKIPVRVIRLEEADVR